MKLLTLPKTIISGFLGSTIALGLFPVLTVNAQTKLHSVPEIGWNTRLSSFELDSRDEGQVFAFSCPTAPQNRVDAPVWGTDTYTVNSGLCQAAVHAGVITSDGGLINVELTAEESDYQGSARFGVSSKSYQREILSIKFVGNPIAVDSSQSDREDTPTNPRRRPSTVERTVGNGVRRGVERTISDSIRDIFR